MKAKTLDDFSFKGKRVIVRVDLNSEIIDGKVSLSERFLAPVKTIKELVKKKAKIVLLAHQGRPGKDDYSNLEQHAKLLNKYVKLKFVPDVIGEKAVNAIKSLKDGEVLLLDNVRGLKEEFEPSKDNIMAKTLAPLFDYYVNDAFSNSHRNHTSMVTFAQMLPSCAGRDLEEELTSLEKIKIDDCLFILGGSKPEDNLLLLKNKNVITCGIFGQVCLISKGYNLGAQNEFLKDKLQYVPKIKESVEHVETPVDLAVKIDGKRKDLKLEEFPSKYEIFDIGPETMKKYVEKIKNAKGIFWKGTAGYCEDEQFSVGTKTLLKAVTGSKAFSILGGGHTTTALDRMKISKKKIGHISLSGGALVNYMAGEKLPAIEALQNV
ncbi:phosphoglycerate kinase [Candidatus Woesearchaeota archaeon]|nr:phosphoglycerate kinase [Candidatus Woesearchaeota archaeon]